MAMTRRVLLYVHLTVALVASVFVLIFAVTGSIMAFEPELEHLTRPHLFYVRPQGEAKSLAEITAAIAQAYPGQRVMEFLMPSSPDLAYQALIRSGAVHINQYTGEILGIRPLAVDWLGRVHQFHLRLGIMIQSDPGKKIMSWAGVAVLILLLSGLYLWWPLKRVGVAWSGAARRVWFDLHNSVGILSFVFVLLLAVTGVVIGFEAQTTPLLFRLTGSKPSDAPNQKLPEQPGVLAITPDQAVQIARATLPGAAPNFFFFPGPRHYYVLSMRYPEDRTPGGRSQIYIDEYTGKPLYVLSSRTAPGGTKLVNLNRALHTGDIFGIPSKAVLSLASLMMAVQLVSGVIIWIKRRGAEKRAKTIAG